MIETIWFGLPIMVQDALTLAGLLLPLVATGLICLTGFRVAPLVTGLLRKHASLSATFVFLVAASVGISVALIAQERGLREGTARAADKFDLIVAAPGSEITALLAAVYLQPSAIPLLDGETYAQLEQHPLVDLVAPLAFGDSWQGVPVVGTTPAFVEHLSEGLNTGRVFATVNEAVVGARVALNPGDELKPSHGDGSEGPNSHDHTYEIVGRMERTGSPWDNAILVSVESVWGIHGMPMGHGPDWDWQVGGPFEPSEFAGTPAALVRANELWANYSLQSEFNTSDTMALFPGSVLAQLHALMGDIRQVMSILAVTTQVLVAIAVLAGLSMLSRILAKRMALLRALGAPERFVFAVTWSFAMTLIVTGAVIGLLLGVFLCFGVSAVITSMTSILVEARLAWPEIHLVAAFVSAVGLFSLLPAYRASRRSVLTDLRS